MCALGRLMGEEGREGVEVFLEKVKTGARGFGGVGRGAGGPMGGGFPSWQVGVALVGGVFVNGVDVDWVMDFRPESFKVCPAVGHVVRGGAGVLVVFRLRVGKGTFVVQEMDFFIEDDV